MTLKDILEKTRGQTDVKITLCRYDTVKYFISTAHDILHNEKLWLDKEVHYIELDLDTGKDGDDAFVKLCITLKTEQKT